jgi:hypothetical protein
MSFWDNVSEFLMRIFLIALVASVSVFLISASIWFLRG